MEGERPRGEGSSGRQKRETKGGDGWLAFSVVNKEVDNVLKCSVDLGAKMNHGDTTTKPEQLP